MMNPNLMNPEIVTRLAREREMEMRRQVVGLRQAEFGLDSPTPARPQVRAQKRHGIPVYTFFAWLFARVARQG